MLEEMREGKRKAGAAACNKMTDGNSGANNGRVNGRRVEATNRHDKSAEDDVTDEATTKQVANASQPLDDHRISDSDETLEHQCKESGHSEDAKLRLAQHSKLPQQSCCAIM